MSAHFTSDLSDNIYSKLITDNPKARESGAHIKAERRRRVQDLLTHKRLLEVLDYNQDTGIFKWKCALGRGRIGSTAGYIKKGYVITCIDGNKCLAHRLAWFYVNGEWPSTSLDHLNGIRTDNRIKNLRCATTSENNQNRRNAHSNNLSGFLGVCTHKPTGRFQAMICNNGHKVSLGYFSKPEEAHEAYILAKRDIHKFCTI